MITKATGIAPLVEARWYEKEPDGRVLCTLCPRACKIPDGKRGFCFIRRAEDGKLWTTGYGHTTGFAIDPIEKKPFNHFLPGTTAFSFGTAGCNLGCLFCQNWVMTKARADEVHGTSATCEQVVAGALDTGCASIAYTYNEPVIFGEFVVDTARLARKAGLKNVLKTNGYVSPGAREEIYESIDAANVDLKAFTEDFYRKRTLSTLAPVLDTLKWIKAKTDVWLEVTTLVIPGLNDSDEEIRAESAWILGELGPDVPVHFTAFHPSFRMLDRPRTPLDTLSRARTIALEEGIRFVYTGNVLDDEGQSTRCPSCGTMLVERNGLLATSVRIGSNGLCPHCATKVPGVWGTAQLEG